MLRSEVHAPFDLGLLKLVTVGDGLLKELNSLGVGEALYAESE